MNNKLKFASAVLSAGLLVTPISSLINNYDNIAKANNIMCPAKIENNKIIDFKNYKELKNFKDIEEYLNLNNMKFLSAYQIEDDEKIVAIINYFNEEDNTYYNLYTDETPEIKFVSTQTEEKNKDKTFKLYSWNGVEFDNSFSISLDKNNKEKDFKLNNRSTRKELAFSWSYSFVFGKLVETFGSKEYGCTLFKNGKLTWDYINNG